MKKNKFGFTLIEVLAVVLTVAILTSIAVPQYRKSIRRAEAMEALVNLRAVYDSAKRYRSANSEAPKKLNGLDVEFFDAKEDDGNQTFYLGKFQYKFDDDYVEACRLSEYCLRFYYNHKDKGKDTLTCRVKDSNATGDWLCKSLGSAKAEDKRYLDANEYLIP